MILQNFFNQNDQHKNLYKPSYRKKIFEYCVFVVDFPCNNPHIPLFTLRVCFNMRESQGENSRLHDSTWLHLTPHWLHLTPHWLHYFMKSFIIIKPVDTFYFFNWVFGPTAVWSHFHIRSIHLTHANQHVGVGVSESVTKMQLYHRILYKYMEHRTIDISWYQEVRYIIYNRIENEKEITWSLIVQITQQIKLELKDIDNIDIRINV